MALSGSSSLGSVVSMGNLPRHKCQAVYISWEEKKQRRESFVSCRMAIVAPEVWCAKGKVGV